MRYIDRFLLVYSKEAKEEADRLSQELQTIPHDKIGKFVNSKREDSWGSKEVIKTLLIPVGPKCWYSEILLEGADMNVDHFRPKGNIRELDISQNITPTGKESDGYWWCAFDLDNFRLSSQHANQRRVDDETDGGKWDFFPVDGERAVKNTKSKNIHERNLALDPCKPADVNLLAFDTDGRPIWSGQVQTSEDFDKLRVRLSIWLYHLNKGEIDRRRRAVIHAFDIELNRADIIYQIWQDEKDSPMLRNAFDNCIQRIRHEISDKSEFSMAKFYKIKSKINEYSWIQDFILRYSFM